MLLAPIFLAAAATLPSRTAEVRGRVVGSNGSPAAGVVVSARETQSDPEAALHRDEGKESPEAGRVDTGSDGRFRLALPAGRWTVIFAGRDLATGTLDVDLEAGEADDEGDVAMSASRALAGSVTDEKGRPMSGAQVSIRGDSPDSDLALRAVATTDSAGRFTVPDAAASIREITAVARGVPQVQSFRFGGRRGGRSVSSYLRMEGGRTVSGKTVRPDGSPASGMVVTASGHAARSGDDGSFVLRGVSAKPGTSVEVVSDDWRGSALIRSTDAPLTIRLSPAGRLTGTVVDAVTRRPVPRAVLRLGKDGATFANRKGTFEFRGLAAGAETLSVSRVGYGSLPEYPVEIAAGKTARADLALVPMATIEGRVIDAAKNPVADARVESGGIESAGARSGKDGRFTVFADPRTVASLRIAANGFAPATVHGLHVRPAERKTGVVVTLSRGLSASGRVVDEQRQPVAGAKIEYAPAIGGRRGRGALYRGRVSSAPPPFVVSDARGKFVLAHLEPGDYALTVDHDRFAERSVPEVRIEKDGTAIGDVELEAPAAIEGIVRDSSGDPVPSVTVRGHAGTADEEAESGPDGRFRLTRFPSGARVNLFAFASGYGLATCAAQAPQSGIVVTLAKSGIIRGRVEEAGSGNPVTAFTIGWDTPRSRFGGGLIGQGGQPFEQPDGTFEMSLQPGTWELVARASGLEPATIGGVEIAAGDVREGLVFSMRPGAAIEGTVVDDPTGAPVPGAAVSWSPAGEARVTMLPGGGMMWTDGSGSAATDAAGRFRLAGIPSAEKITVTAQDYDHSPASLDLAPGGASGLVIRLPGGATISGALVDAMGHPPAAGEVDLQPLGASGADGSQTPTDAGGGFTFDHLKPGTYSLTGRDGARNAAPVEVALAAGQNAGNVILTLAGGTSIVGQVSGLSAGELSGVRISASGASGFSGYTSPAADGRYEIDGAPSGEVKVTGNVPGTPGRTLSQTAEITSDQSQIEVDLAFPAGSTLSGAVTRGGTPQASMLVSVQPQTPGGTPTQGRGQTDESGRYSIPGLADGDYVARVFALGGGGSSARFEQPVTISGDTTQDFDLPTLSCAGTVVENGSSDPVAGAKVTLDDGNASTAFAIPHAITDSSGAFEIDGIAGGDVRLMIEKSGWQTLTQSLSIDSSVSGASYALSRAEGITVHALDGRTGTPLSVLHAVFFAAGGAFAFSGPVTLDSTGKGEVPQLAPGAYAAYFFADGYAAQAFGGLAIPAPPITLGMTGGGELDVRTDDAHGGAVAALATASGLPWLWSAVRFDPSFALAGPLTQRPHLSAGDYVLTVQWPDGPKSYPVSIGEGQTTTIRVP